MSHQTNVTRIKAVSNALKALNVKVVFVGGSTVSFYSDRPSLEVRPTDDVDLLVEILNYKERTQIEERLRILGFSHDLESGIVCRYLIEGITVDIMPTEDPSIGFTNIWYSEGFKFSVQYVIDDQNIIEILDAPYFVATKFEAFGSRGRNDGRTSEDFEDIIFVLENRKAIWEEMNNAGTDLKNYLKAKFRNLLSNNNIVEWVSGHISTENHFAANRILEEIFNFVVEDK
ncbi:MAG: hypothetical protein ABIV51_07825 [Saprospiraceae bacterium]